MLNQSVPEPLVEGEYTSLVNPLKIHNNMNTASVNVGGYSLGVPFVVYEVFPEKDGIVWGRVSSNSGYGVQQFVGLRVRSNLKAKLSRAFKPIPTPSDDIASAIRAVASNIADLRSTIIDLYHQGGR